MNIKKLLAIIIFFVLCVSLLFSISIVVSLQSYKGAIKKTEIVHQIVTGVFQRRLVADDYLSNPSPRAFEQWLAKLDSISQVVHNNEAAFSNSEEKTLITALQSDLMQSKDIFKQVVAEKNHNATGSALLSEKYARLTSQLLVKEQETITTVTQLYDVNSLSAKNALQQVIYLFSAAASLFFIMLFGSFWLIWRSANKLEISDLRYSLVSQGTNDVVWDWDLVNDKIIWNESIEKLFGYKKAEIPLTSSWWDEHIHPDDRARIDKKIECMLSSMETSWSDEYRFQKNDGSYAYVIDRGFVSRDKSGKATRFVGSMQDITERKQLEQNLKDRTNEAERLNRITIDRELKMIELKKEKAGLLQELKNKTI